jgi:hypothetical protein
MFMSNQDHKPETPAISTNERAHWIAPRLTQFRAGEAEAGASVGPDGPETGVS